MNFLCVHLVSEWEKSEHWLMQVNNKVLQETQYQAQRRCSATVFIRVQDVKDVHSVE